MATTIAIQPIVKLHLEFLYKPAETITPIQNAGRRNV